MDLKGKVAVVTGSSRGLGRASAIELAKCGVDIVVNYLKSKKQADEVVASIKALGRNALAIQADVAHYDQVQRLQQESMRAFGHIDILVNNAGAIIRPATWNEISEKDIDNTIGVNLRGPINGIRAFAPTMIEQKQGRIINITTTYAITGAAAVLVYTAAKAGVISMTYSMARELGPHGITVNALAPGNFLTDMAIEAGDAVNNWAVSTTPLARLGKPEEVGEAVVYLARTDFITGHVLVLDGGQLLNM